MQIILCPSIVANTLHSSVNGLLLMECLCVGVHHPAKQRFGVGRHNSHFRNSNFTYSTSAFKWSHVPTAAKLLCTTASHLALWLSLKKKNCFF